MEPLAIAASLATVVQLANYGLDFAFQMKKFLRQVRTVEEDMDYFLHEVESSSQSIILARNVLDEYYSSHPGSQSLRFMSTENILGNLEHLSRMTRSRMKGAKGLMISIESRFKLITLFKWNLRKDSVLDASFKLKSIQTTMSVLMNAAQLEEKTSKIARMERSGSREDRVEIKRLKKEVEMLQKIMIGLIEATKRESVRSGQGRTLSERQLLDSLVKLGKNAAKPLETSPTPSPVHSESSSHRQSHSHTTGRSTLSGSRVSSAGRDLESLRRQSRSYALPSPTNTMSYDPDDDDIKPGFRQSITSLESFPEETVQMVLDLSNDLHWQAIVGNISAPGSGPKTVPKRWAAMLYRGLDRNVISLVRAKHLGLPDPVMDGSDVEIMIDTGNGKPSRSLGKTTLEWRGTVRSSMHEPNLTVECEVCDCYDQSGGSGLWFGRPFLEVSSRSVSRT